MPDTFTPNLNLDKPAISAYDIWGAKFNSNMDLIDAASANLRGTPVSATAPTTGQVLKFNGTNWAPGTDSAGVPAGSSGMVQYNGSGAFAASTDLFWDATHSSLGIRTNNPYSFSGAVLAIEGYDGFSLGCSFNAGPVHVGPFANRAPRNSQLRVHNDTNRTEALSLMTYDYDTGVGSSLVFTFGAHTGDTFSRIVPLISGGSATGNLTLEGVFNGVGMTTPGYTLDVGGDANISGVYRVGGTQIASSNLSDAASLITTATALGGDLSGFLPNPTVAAINGVTVTGTPTAGQVPTATGGAAATWQTPATTPPAGANGYVQFYDTGAFGGDTNLFWDNTNKRLGVGTAVPATLLHVAGAGSGSYGVYDTPVRLEGSYATYIEFVGASSQAGLILNIDGSTGWLTGIGSGANYHVGPIPTIDQSGLTAAKDGTTGITILPSGFTGLNTVTPTAVLHVFGASLGSYGIYDVPMKVEGSYTSYAEFVGKNSQAGLILNIDGSTGWLTGIASGANYHVGPIPTIDQSGLTSAILSTAGLTIYPNGNTGINTATPAYTLDVGGDVNVTGQYKVSGAQIASTNLSDSASIIKTSTTLGGDLSGSLPNPTVAAINGVTVTGTPTAGQVPTATSGSTATWQTPASAFVLVPAPTGNATTDTTNITNALTTGGHVVLQAGTYVINSDLFISAGTNMTGQGIGVTTIQADAAFTSNFMIFYDAAGDQDNLLYLADFTIDSNYAGRGTRGDADFVILTYGSAIVERVRYTNSAVGSNFRPPIYLTDGTVFAKSIQFIDCEFIASASSNTSQNNMIVCANTHFENCLFQFDVMATLLAGFPIVDMGNGGSVKGCRIIINATQNSSSVFQARAYSGSYPPGMLVFIANIFNGSAVISGQNALYVRDPSYPLSSVISSNLSSVAGALIAGVTTGGVIIGNVGFDNYLNGTQTGNV